MGEGVSVCVCVCHLFPSCSILHVVSLERGGVSLSTISRSSPLVNLLLSDVCVVVCVGVCMCEHERASV